MVEGQEVTQVQVRQKDETGTIQKAMSRQEVTNEISRQIVEMKAEYADKLTPEQNAAADKLLNRVQQGIAMLNMFLNAMIADTAATTVYNMQAQFKLADFLQYQASFNDQMAAKMDIIEAAVLELRRKK